MFSRGEPRLSSYTNQNQPQITFSIQKWKALIQSPKHQMMKGQNNKRCHYLNIQGSMLYITDVFSAVLRDCNSEAVNKQITT